jgi:short-subunit dehydrogenase
MLDLLIITGASKGIGASIVNKCANSCKNMIITASSESILTNKIKGNANIIPLKMDLSDFTSCESIIDNTIRSLNINSLGIVLCGGQIGEYGGLLNNSLADTEYLYRCNVLGNLAIIKGCEKYIKSNIKTRIVFFAGGGAAFAFPEFFAYSLTKVAIVRAVENLSIEFTKSFNLLDTSIIALAPGAVDTQMLKKVIDSGSEIRTKTDISEPTNFVFNFLLDKINSNNLNGKFLHVRDDLMQTQDYPDIFTLRRMQ